MSTRLRVLVVALLLPLVLAGCGVAGTSTSRVAKRREDHASSVPVDWKAPIWLLAASHLRGVLADPAADAVLRSGTLLEPIGPHQQPVPFAIPVSDFHSEALLAREAGSLKGVRAIIYDNERFANTPVSEQRDPYGASVAAASVARAHDLVAICDFLQPDRLPVGERSPEDEVPPCGVIGLNTVQQSERSVAGYVAVVKREVLIIRSVRPDVPILAGLSANPKGAPVTAAELTADMEAVRGLVNGFWLNVPAPGVGCPRCHAPDPSLLATALAALPKGFTTRPVAGPSATMVASATASGSVAEPQTTPEDAKAVLVSPGALARMGISDEVAIGLLHARLLVLGAMPPALAGATAVAYFTSAQAAVRALDEGSVHARWLLLDLERWRFTPRAEQRDPTAAVARVSTAARSHGVALIVSLASDLFPGGMSGLVRSDALTRVAPLAVGFELQVQAVEDRTGSYRAAVEAAATVLRRANPGIQIFAGLTSASRPHEPAPTAKEVTADLAATARLVDGYWLNVPVPGGAACPRCGAGNPAVTALALRELAR